MMDACSIRDARILAHVEMVRAVAARAIARFGLPKDLFDDLVGAGMLGLIEAADRFDPKQNVPFDAYARPRIFGSIVDYIRRSMGVSRQAYKRRQAFTRGEPHATVVEGEMCTRVAWEESRIRPEEETPETVLIRQETLAALTRFVDDLPPKERLIVLERYFADCSFADICRDKRCGLSTSWVSRLHARALSSLRQAHSFLNDPNFN